jgi:hypothetical protein
MLSHLTYLLLMKTEILYKIADSFFYIFHVCLIVFNLFGWIPKKLRKWNLISLGLTAFSWFVLGIFYGFGYCFLTDWHWDVREALGHSIESDSYIHFLITELTGISVNEKLVDTFTAILFFTALALSIYVNIKSGWLRRPKE